MKIFSISLLALLVLSSTALAVSASGTSFSTPVKLGAGFDPNVQSVGSHVYVTWTDKTHGIYFRASSDDGKTWSAPIKVGTGGDYPLMSASGGYVYIAWSSGGIKLAASSNYGASFSSVVKLSAKGGVTPTIGSNGQLVSVAYNVVNGGGSFVTTSSNAGKTWTTPFLYSNGPEPEVAVSGTNVYVVADEINRAHVQFGVSHDSGRTWTVNSEPPGSEAMIVATGSDVYAAWETKSTSSMVWFLSSTDNGNTINTQIISGSIKDAWNPAINAIGSDVWVGIQQLSPKSNEWMLTSTNGGSTWTTKLLTKSTGTKGFQFTVATTDGTNVFTMWIQKSGTSSSAMAAFSGNGGSSWSLVNLGPSDPNKDVAIGSISSDGSHGLAAWQYQSQIYFSGS